jgi:protein gp37
MGENSKIAWCDHTFNGWWGCTRVSPACDFCYAADLDARHYNTPHWGAGVPRKLNGEHTWNEPYRWDARALRMRCKPRVFCMSMGDWADKEVPKEWRQRKYKTWRETKNLRWMCLTKRIGNAEKMLEGSGFPDGFEHVGFMATIANQEEADRDIPKLLRFKAAYGVPWVGISVEPMLGRIDASEWLVGHTRLDQVIIGGESGTLKKVRPFVIENARDLMHQCQRAGVAVFIKQFGRLPTLAGKRVHMRHDKGEDMAEWPSDMRVQEYPPFLQGSGFPDVPPLPLPTPAPASPVTPDLLGGAA